MISSISYDTSNNEIIITEGNPQISNSLNLAPMVSSITNSVTTIIDPQLTLINNQLNSIYNLAQSDNDTIIGNELIDSIIYNSNSHEIKITEGTNIKYLDLTPLVTNTSSQPACAISLSLEDTTASLEATFWKLIPPTL